MYAGNPYPGLRPFERQDSDFFFGREEQTDELLRKLSQFRLLAIVGDSGCGKSSLVRAGLLPALEVGYMAEMGIEWRMATMRPGTQPIARLAEALMEKSVLGNESDETDKTRQCIIEAVLRRGPRGIVEVLQELKLNKETNLLVLVDQFEELFRFKNRAASDEAAAFVALLLETAAERELPVYIVLTMRSDYIGECTRFQQLPEVLSKSIYITPHLTRDQLRDAIVKPAKMYDGIVEADLVNDLLNETNQLQDQLPILQHALMRMWFRAENGCESAAGRKLTRQLYTEIGRMKDALEKHAEEVYEALEKEEKHIAYVLFRTLSEGGSGRDLRCPSSLKDIADKAHVETDKARSVIDVFRNEKCGFITPELSKIIDDTDLLDLSHESLLRLWPRLRKLNRKGQEKIWTDDDLQKWMDNKSNEIYRNRVTTWHTSKPLEEILDRYRYEVPLDRQVDDKNEDWFQAGVYLGAAVLDDVMSLIDNFESFSYKRLEKVWLRDIKKLKAYFNCKKNSEPQSEQLHYFNACHEIRRMLMDPSRKAGSTEFSPIQDYITNYSMVETNQLYTTVQWKEKFKMLQENRYPEDFSRQTVDDYMSSFYGNISRAVTSTDESCTLQILKTLGFYYDKDNCDFKIYDNIVNCFELAVAIQFLNAELVTKILSTV